jgi:hypothetical protein
MTVTAVVDDEDIQPGAAKAQHLIDIHGNITRIPMQVKERSRARFLRWNPPTRDVISFQRKPDFRELHARVGRRGVDKAIGVVEDLRLRVPNCPCKEEVTNCDSGKQCPD